MHANILCISYTGKDDPNAMMNNEVDYGKYDYYDRIPLKLADGTMEDISKSNGNMIQLSSVDKEFLKKSVYEVLDTYGDYSKSVSSLDRIDKEQYAIAKVALFDVHM